MRLFASLTTARVVDTLITAAVGRTLGAKSAMPNSSNQGATAISWINAPIGNGKV